MKLTPSSISWVICLQGFRTLTFDLIPPLISNNFNRVLYSSSGIFIPNMTESSCTFIFLFHRGCHIHITSRLDRFLLHLARNKRCQEISSKAHFTELLWTCNEAILNCCYIGNIYKNSSFHVQEYFKPKGYSMQNLVLKHKPTNS